MSSSSLFTMVCLAGEMGTTQFTTFRVGKQLICQTTELFMLGVSQMTPGDDMLKRCNRFLSKRPFSRVKLDWRSHLPRTTKGKSICNSTRSHVSCEWQVKGLKNFLSCIPNNCARCTGINETQKRNSPDGN